MDGFRIPLGSWVEGGVSWVKANLDGLLDVVSFVVTFLVDGLTSLLLLLFGDPVGEVWSTILSAPKPRQLVQIINEATILYLSAIAVAVLTPACLPTISAASSGFCRHISSARPYACRKPTTASGYACANAVRTTIRSAMTYPAFSSTTDVSYRLPPASSSLLFAGDQT